MKKTLYIKLLIAYLIFAIFGFIIVATFMQQMTINQLRKNKAEELYRTALWLSENDALMLYKNELSLNSMKAVLDLTSAMQQARIQILNPSGLVMVDSGMPVDLENTVTIEGFDITALSGSFYSVGSFYHLFESEHLSVAAPITLGYAVRGYVVVHYDMEHLQDAADHLLDIDYIMLIILFFYVKER